MWSIFENEFKAKVGEKYEWVTQLNFYMGDLSKVDHASDYRFIEVKDRRKQVRFKGLADVEFPVEFPLMLDDGTVLHDDYYHNKISMDEN